MKICYHEYAKHLFFCERVNLLNFLYAAKGHHSWYKQVNQSNTYFKKVPINSNKPLNQRFNWNKTLFENVPKIQTIVIEIKKNTLIPAKIPNLVYIQLTVSHMYSKYQWKYQ